MRPLRIQFPYATYHITVRGNRKNTIFFDDEDRRMFLKILARTVESHNWICHAYCLMNNHFHLAIETPDGNLSKVMRDLNGMYTQVTNKRHGLVGHLFQGRFSSFLIEQDKYFLEVVRYIVLNPIRANLVKKPEEWIWSSYSATAGYADRPTWLTTKWIYNYFSNDLNRARESYRKFVDEGIGGESPFNQIKEGNILGSQQFKDETEAKHESIFFIKEIKKADRIIGRPELAECFENINNDISMRNVAIRIAHFRCGYPLAEIARFIGLTPAAVGKIAHTK